ncbi:MAG TPA: hypothetical protein VG733_13905 [Chthoniobacteraceae bacterium]|nr:hypothetical protein [Chthoniobacteraceae bacterium]
MKSGISFILGAVALFGSLMCATSKAQEPDASAALKPEVFKEPVPPPDDGQPGLIEIDGGPTTWDLKIARDGSGSLGGGASYLAFFPKGTFSFHEVCDKLKLIGNPVGDKGVHYGDVGYTFFYGGTSRLFLVGDAGKPYLITLFARAKDTCTLKAEFDSWLKKNPFILPNKEK